MLLGKGQTSLHAQDREQRGQRIGMHAFGVQHADAGQIVRNRLAAARIQRVRVAASLPVVAVVQIARGGNRHVAQGNGGGWLFGRRAGDGGNGHAPGLAAGALAAGAQFAANFDQAVGQIQSVQRVQHGIDGVAFGDAAQIQVQAAALAPAALWAMLQALPVAAGLRDL